MSLEIVVIHRINGKREPLPELGSVVFGRDLENPLNLTLDCPVALSKCVSRSHCTFVRYDLGGSGGLAVRDEGSMNGTYVNDKIITSETSLKNGDVVRCSSYELGVEMPELTRSDDPRTTKEYEENSASSESDSS